MLTIVVISNEHECAVLANRTDRATGAKCLKASAGDEPRGWERLRERGQGSQIPKKIWKQAIGGAGKRRGERSRSAGGAWFDVYL